MGELLGALEATRQEATVVFVSDHGDMLGERGLWFKMTFFEGSARVPLMIADADMAPGLVKTPVSTIDVTATLGALAGGGSVRIVAVDRRAILGSVGTRRAAVGASGDGIRRRGILCAIGGTA